MNLADFIYIFLELLFHLFSVTVYRKFVSVLTLPLSSNQ
jgi:hypothetical protein